jgi:hypothetical protein
MSTFRAVADAVVGTLQLAVFAALALAPLAAAFVAGVGPPTHTATVADIVPGNATGETVGYDTLDAESQAVVDDLLSSERDRVERTTGDPPPVLEPGERVVQREGYAVRVAVERSTPRRPPVLLAGLLGSTFTTLLGAVVVERDFVG